MSAAIFGTETRAGTLFDIVLIFAIVAVGTTLVNVFTDPPGKR